MKTYRFPSLGKKSRSFSKPWKSSAQVIPMVGIFAVLLFQPVASLSNPSAENAGATNLLPLTDNRQPPFMGLYENVPKAGGIDQVDEYAT